MLIALDIGNSSIHIGFFTEAGLFVRMIDTHPILQPPQYLSLVNKFIKEINIDKTPEGIIISSVVPGHTEVLSRSLSRLTPAKPLLVSAGIETGLKFGIPGPEQLGSDRIANVVAAYRLCECPAAAVDFGTATTISVVGEGAVYIGGAIMPGVRLMSTALASGTSKLFEVPLEPPPMALGAGTAECIQSGLFYGTAGAVERLLSEMEKEAGFGLTLFVTGGYAGLLSKFLTRSHEMRPHLTLEGLKEIYMRNRDA